MHHIKAVNLQVELLGGFRMLRGGQAVSGVSTTRLQSLIAYLVLHAGMPVSRQQLAFLFWPDSQEAQARTNLRQLLHNLRAALPEIDQLLHADQQTLCWRPGACVVDAALFQHAVEQDDLEEAARLYRGDLLPGIYDDWLDAERERFKRQYETALERLTAAAEQRRDLAAAINFAEIRLARDTLREAGYQTLMRLLALKGDRAGALRVYQQCAEVLRHELDVEPGPATRRARDLALYERQPAPEPAPAAAPAPPPQRELPLIGREREWQQLRKIWRRAAAGRPLMVILTGEPGIGKSRLLEELLDLASREGVSTARTTCYAGDRALAYTAAADWLRSPLVRSKWQELPAIQRSQLARVLPEILAEQPDVAPPPPFTEAWQKRHFFEAMARGVLAPRPPLLLAIDDLHWCDPETLEWLQFLLRLDPSTPLLAAATARSEELDSLRPLLRSDFVSEIALEPLDPEHTGRLASELSTRRIEPADAEALYRQTRGNPLFVVETVRAGLPANGVASAKVHAVIRGRLAKLGAGARDLAGVAAVIGRPFPTELIAGVASLSEDPAVQALDELWQHRILLLDDNGMYDFSHGCLRDVAYDLLGPARRRQLHRRVAEALEASEPAEADALCSQIAAHYERALLPMRAIPHYARAAEVVRRRFAESEAVAYLGKALRLLETLPPSPERDRTELDLLLALGPSLAATQGYASEETGRVYARARLLCEISRQTERSFGVLAGSWTFHAVRAEIEISRDIAQRFLSLAETAADPILLAAGHFCLASSAFHLGSIREALRHVEASLHHQSQSDRPFFDFGPELGVFCRSYLVHCTCLLGDPDQALEHSRQNVARAVEIAHPFSLALAQAYAAMLHHFRDEPEAARDRAEEVAALCRKYGFRYYLSWTPILAGWAVARLGDPQTGLAEMLRGFADLRATGAGIRAPYYLGLIAEAYGESGDVDRGLAHLSEALALGERTSEAWVRPELQRIQGDLLRRAGRLREAETCYRNAVRLARQMGARAWEQRAESRLKWHGPPGPCSRAKPGRVSPAPAET
jgi:DNA-binding SARP family transcriptional activator/predicted ATPase